jgi:hypothetical protein
MENWREKGHMVRSKEKEKQAGRKTATMKKECQYCHHLKHHHHQRHHHPVGRSILYAN